MEIIAIPLTPEDLAVCKELAKTNNVKIKHDGKFVKVIYNEVKDTHNVLDLVREDLTDFVELFRAYIKDESETEKTETERDVAESKEVTADNKATIEYITEYFNRQLAIRDERTDGISAKVARLEEINKKVFSLSVLSSEETVE